MTGQRAQTEAGTAGLDKAARRARRRRRFRRAVTFVVLLLTAGVIFWGLLAREGGVRLPDLARVQLERSLTRALPEGAALTVDEARLGLTQTGRPVLALRNLALGDAEGRPVARVPESRVTLSGWGLARARMQPVSVRMVGLSLLVDRDAQGAFLLSFGEGRSLPPIRDLADLVALIDTAMATPPVAGMERIALSDLRLILRDARAGRSFDFRNGALDLIQTDRAFEVRLSVDLGDEYGLPSPANATLRLASDKGSLQAEVSGNLTEVPMSAISAQSPRLSWLEAVDAPLSGAFRGQTDAEGRLGTVAGTLELGAGAVRLGPVPIALEALKAYLTFDPGAQRVRLQQLELASDALSLQATGHSDLIWPTPDRRGAVRSQLTVTNLALDLPQVFEGPVRFDRIQAATRLQPGAAALQIGQVVLTQGDTRLRLSGQVQADAMGQLGARLDGHVDRITPQAALALWPLIAAPKTRRYLATNMQGGVVEDVSLALRLAAEAAPIIGLNGRFADAGLRYLPDLPPLERANGVFSMIDNRLAVNVEAGELADPAGRIDVAGTSFVVLDTRQRPGQAEVDLKLDAGVPALLSALSNPPVDLGLADLPLTGRARIGAKIAFATGQPPGSTQAVWSGTGRLTDLRSDALLPGRSLRATDLRLAADPQTGLRVSGPVTMDGVAVEMVLNSALTGDPADRRVEVAGQLDLTADSLDRLGLAFDGLAVSGRAPAQILLSVTPGAPAALRLVSDLQGLGLSLPGLGWSKAASAGADLALDARLGSAITVPALSLSAPGLDLTGSVRLRADGGLAEAQFDRLRVADWLDGQAVLEGQGAGGPVALRVTGGQADLRGLAGLGEGGGAARGPIEITLERLQITDTLALSPFSARLAPGRALDGVFSGTLNGRAVLSGRMVGTGGPGGLRVQVLSENAGAALAALGVLRNGRGGALQMVMQRDPAQARTWVAQVQIADLVVVDAPILAEMLSALSIVGLLDQMGSGGITFADTFANLTFGPSGVVLRDGRAVGPSMGITAEGSISPETGQVTVQGVVSPLYVLNGLGGLFAPRRGEGLFGFNYVLEGAIRQPQITVNPLSILTPGVFRELFRRAPPTLD